MQRRRPISELEVSTLASTPSGTWRDPRERLVGHGRTARYSSADRHCLV